MGARTFWALSRDSRDSKLICRHNLREHKETHIVVERDARRGWQRPYIRIELLSPLTLRRRGKCFNLAPDPLQHCWLHPVFPPGLVTKCSWTFACKRTIKPARTRQFFRWNSERCRRNHAHRVGGSG